MSNQINLYNEMSQNFIEYAIHKKCKFFGQNLQKLLSYFSYNNEAK